MRSSVTKPTELFGDDSNPFMVILGMVYDWVYLINEVFLFV